MEIQTQPSTGQLMVIYFRELRGYGNIGGVLGAMVLFVGVLGAKPLKV